jgi:azurin
MTGWGNSDTHAGPSNLKYGFDNQIWGVLGYSGFDGKVGDKKMKFSQGVYRFTPDGKQLEYLASTSNNTWGLGFSEENDVFISTANNTHSAFLGIPKRYFTKDFGGNKTQPVKKIDGHYDMHVVFPNLRQVDVFGGFTAAAGHNLYTARSFPKSYWNKVAFVCEPTGRVVHQAIMQQNGAGFIEKDGWNFLASADEWAGPVHAEVGPDGAVWIADWYDFIIQHNPTPRGFENGAGNAYINPLRDREKGRIYRIVYKDAKPYKPIQLSRNDIPGLLSALKSDNMFWRTTAQRLLVESKSQTALPELYKIVNNTTVDDIGLNGPAVHALWTLHGLGALNGSNQEALKEAIKALSHPVAAVRKAALDVLPKNASMGNTIRQSNTLQDKDLRVRLAAVLAISDLPANEEAGEMIYQASQNNENLKDEWISRALFTAASTHQIGYAKAYTKNKLEASAFSAQVARGLEKGAETEIKSVDSKAKGNGLPTIEIELKVIEQKMQFDKKTFTVKVGQKVILKFSNPDFMQHNWVLIKPGSAEKVGEASDALARDPKGPEKNYVPEIPEVLKATKLLNPEETVTLEFTAPQNPGSYPYLCTFPGHWRIMNGIMKVTR